MLIPNADPDNPCEVEVMNVSASAEFQQLLNVLQVINFQQATAGLYCSQLAHNGSPLTW
jgi:hypothetical protein